MARTADKTDIPRRLTAAGHVLFAQHGYNATGIQQITDQAKVPKGSFYNHFATKEELFDAALAEALDMHGALLDDLAESSEDPAETFARSFRLTGRALTSAGHAVVQAAARLTTALGGGVQEVQPQATAPSAGQSTLYYTKFTFTVGATSATTSNGVVKNHIPLDPMMTASLNVAQNATEAGQSARFTVSMNRTNNTGSGLTFDLKDLATGTATSGLDYPALAAGQKLTVQSGASSGSFDLVATDDALVESDETVSLKISNPAIGGTDIASFTTLTADTGLATIVDNDHAPVFTAPNATIDWFAANQFWGVALVEALSLYPIIYLNAVAALANIDPAMEEAAENLEEGSAQEGCDRDGEHDAQPPFQAWRRLTQLRPLFEKLCDRFDGDAVTIRARQICQHRCRSGIDGQNVEGLIGCLTATRDAGGEIDFAGAGTDEGDAGLRAESIEIDMAFVKAVMAGDIARQHS